MKMFIGNVPSDFALDYENQVVAPAYQGALIGKAPEVNFNAFKRWMGNT